MPDLLLQIWKLVLLGFVYLFLLRVIRAIWANLRTTTTPPRPVTPPPGRPAAPREEPKGINHLKVIEPKEHAGRTYELEAEITIGRAAGCKVNVDDTYVSQLHARVFRRDDQVLIEDLGSTNGTFHNNKKVTGPSALKKGDRIQVGRTVMEAIR
jgi:pSer/pThr/pTyr-binding forkhead associated (FHA) protein